MGGYLPCGAHPTTATDAETRPVSWKSVNRWRELSMSSTLLPSPSCMTTTSQISPRLPPTIFCNGPFFVFFHAPPLRSFAFCALFCFLFSIFSRQNEKEADWCCENRWSRKSSGRLQLWYPSGISAVPPRAGRLRRASPQLEFRSRPGTGSRCTWYTVKRCWVSNSDEKGKEGCRHHTAGGINKEKLKTCNNAAWSSLYITLAKLMFITMRSTGSSS